MSLVRTRLRRKTRKQRLMAFSLLFTHKKTRLIVLNRHRSIQKGNTFLNQSSSRVRSFYRAHSDHFSRHYFFPIFLHFQSISPFSSQKKLFGLFWTRAHGRFRLVDWIDWNNTFHIRTSTHHSTLCCYCLLNTMRIRDENETREKPTWIRGCSCSPETEEGDFRRTL